MQLVLSLRCHLRLLQLHQLDVPHDAGERVLQIVNHHLGHRLLELLHGEQLAVGVLEGDALAFDFVLQRLDPQDGPYLGEQFRLVDRLAEEIVGPGLEGPHLVLERIERRDHDDRKKPRLVAVPQQAAQLEAAHLRHHHIEKNEIGRFRLDALSRLFPIESLRHPVSVRPQDRLHQPYVPLIVVDDHDGGRAVVPLLLHLLLPGAAAPRRNQRPSAASLRNAAI